MEQKHRKLRKAWNLPGHAHELTFCVYRRRPHLFLPGVAETFLRVLDEARHEHRFEVWAYVMPEHVHVLLMPKDEAYEMAEILKGIKYPSDKAIFELHPHLREESRIVRKGRPDEFRFWQAGGGYDRNATHSRTVGNAIRYIHHNPVRKGLCENATDWKWSSAQAHEGGTSLISVDFPWYQDP